RSSLVHLASGARRRALPDGALCRGGRGRATVVVAQPKLAARPALCRRRACPAKQNRGGASSTRRAQAGGRESGGFRGRLAARVPRRGGGRSHSRRASQGRLRMTAARAARGGKPRGGQPGRRAGSGSRAAPV